MSARRRLSPASTGERAVTPIPLFGCLPDPLSRYLYTALICPIFPQHKIFFRYKIQWLHPVSGRATASTFVRTLLK